MKLLGTPLLKLGSTPTVVVDLPAELVEECPLELDAGIP